MEKILITGGLGHIGSKLIQYLDQFDSYQNVTIVDNLYARSFNPIYTLPPTYKLIIKDFKDIDISEYSTIIHLAAHTNITESTSNKNLYLENNTTKTYELVNKIRPDQHLIFASTTSVYAPSNSSVSETSACKPANRYSETKYLAENYIQNECKGKYTILRFGSIFGPSSGIQYHTSINKFCLAAITGNPITVWRSFGDKQLPFTGVSDAVQAIRQALRYQFTGIYNVVTATSCVDEILKFIDQSIKSYIGGPKLDIQITEAPYVSDGNLIVSSAKIESLAPPASYRPTTNMKAAIDNTIRLFGKVVYSL